MKIIFDDEKDQLEEISFKDLIKVTAFKEEKRFTKMYFYLDPQTLEVKGEHNLFYFTSDEVEQTKESIKKLRLRYRLGLLNEKEEGNNESY
jgi:hypothetical protein